MLKAPVINIEVGGVDISGFIQKVKLKEDIEKDNELTLEVKEDYVLLFADSIEIVPDAEVKIQFGYLGGIFSDVYVMVVYDVETTYDTKIALKIKAMDKGADMKRNTRNRVWKQKKPSDIAKEIAADYNMEAEVDESANDYLGGFVPQAGMSDLEMLRELALKEEGYVRCYVTKDKLYFKKEEFDTKPSAQTYNYGSDQRIISFQPKWSRTNANENANTLKPIEVKPETKEVVSKVTDEKTKTMGDAYEVYDFDAKYVNDRIVPAGNPAPTTKTGKDENAGSSQTKANWDNKSEKAEKQRASKMVNITEPDGTANDNTLASIKNEENKKQHTATLKVVGNPRLSIDDVVTMAGSLAKRHQGNWHICSIFHDIDTSGGYVSTISLSRDAQKKINGDKSIASESSNNSVGADQKQAEKRVDIEVFNFDGEFQRDEAVTRERERELFGD